MKKVLSLILALVMVLSLSVTAFAYENVRGDESTINSLTLAVGDVISVTKDLVNEEHKVTNLKFYNLDTTWADGTELVFNGSVPESYCISKRYPSCPSTGVLLVTKAWDETDKTIELAFYASEEDIPAEDPTAKSGSTEITANVAKPELVYEIVIPQAVTMNEAGVVPIGEAKIDITGDKLKNATANTVISYTASGTNFKLSTDETKTMTAKYYSEYTKDVSSTELDPAKSFEVYKNSALVNPLTKLYVGVSQTDWDTAATTNPGTYTATVTYNFSAEEKEATKKFETVGEVLATVEGGFPDEANPWEGDFEEGYEPPSAYKSESNVLSVDCEHRALITYDTSVSESQTTPGDYVAVKEEFNSTFHAYMAWTITFHMTDNVLTSIDAKLDYYANSTGEKTQELTTYNHTNIAPTVGEPK